ncbi:MAG: RHS repeat-associated core domain-containing protein [Saprospiraceae bacterium]
MNRLSVVYDATGRKWRAIRTVEELDEYNQTTGNTHTETRIYMKGMEWVGEGDGGQASQLDCINASPYGRVAWSINEATGETNSRIEYYHTDHLGNVRLAFSDINGDGAITVGDIYAPDNEVVMEQHYYPFGLSHTVPWFATVHPENAYRYNGKEKDEATGLYDYGARYYDPAVGRWTSVDPLADQYAAWSPYNYVLGNPISNIDPDGMQVDNDYGLDIKTGELTLLRKTDDDTHTIYTGTKNGSGDFLKGDKDGFVKSITFDAGISNIEEVVNEFGDAQFGGLVFSGSHEAYAEGEAVMRFISFESSTEIAGWSFDGDSDGGIDGMYINSWDRNTNYKSFDDTDLRSYEIKDVNFTGDYLGERIYKIHTHPDARNRPGTGHANPSTQDMETTNFRTRFPHYIMSQSEGTVRYYPTGVKD